MTLRTLLLSFALASAACTLDITKQIPCKTPGGPNECPSGQTCGSDLLCRELVSTCPDPVKQKQCGNGDCVDITKDPFNCGACNVVCKPGEQCRADEAGVTKCITYCAPGQDPCTQPGTATVICKNLSSDRENCGTCNNQCSRGLVCSPTTPGGRGRCTVECLPGLTSCSGSCLDTTTD